MTNLAARHVPLRIGMECVHLECIVTGPVRGRARVLSLAINAHQLV